jgi:4-aminobutyrate aminotransferase / (S)-3-amino-2-methylpropionate transaminase / 5-aminovalerate transaminase
MQTSRPGTNAELLQRRFAAVPRGVSTATAVFAERAANAEIWDEEGRRFIDFAAGIGVLATGHLHPGVVEAVSEQLRRFSHTAFQVMAYRSYIELAEKLNAIAPFKKPAKTLLLTTGAEAVENAVKIARIATGRPAVIAFSGAFHGRTQLTMALTGKVDPYKVGPLGADVFRIPFPVAHRGVSIDDSLRALESLFYGDVDPKRVAAIIIEPVQGEGGFHVAPPDLFQRLRKVCDTHGILLIADEIQSGFGRAGRMFAIEHSGVEPDLVTLAKSLAGGFPLAAVVGRAEIMDRVEPGGLGGTYAGSPIGCVAALAAIKAIEEQKLPARAEAIGAVIRRRVTAWSQSRVSNLRGLGAMLAFDIVKPDTREPDGAGAKRVAARALENGLLVLTCGTRGETVRMLMPLTITDALLEEGLDILERSLIAAAA